MRNEIFAKTGVNLAVPFVKHHFDRDLASSRFLHTLAIQNSIKSQSPRCIFKSIRCCPLADIVSMAKSESAVNTLQTLTITSTSTPQSTQKPSIRRLAVGPVVGLVVGVAIILATLTGICVFILMRRKSPFSPSKNRTQSSTASQIKLGKRRSGREIRQDPSVKAQDQSAVPEERGTVHYINVDWILSDPISDSELVHDWAMLCYYYKISRCKLLR